MWQQMIKLEKQKREINVLTQKVMAKKQNNQTNLSISISLENTSLFFNSFLGVYITFLPKVSSVKKLSVKLS